jgi:hypothetical protein
MSKNEPHSITTAGASASRSSSVKKVLDIDGRFIDASKVLLFTPGFSPVLNETFSRNRFNGFSALFAMQTVKTVSNASTSHTPG